MWHCKNMLMDAKCVIYTSLRPRATRGGKQSSIEYKSMRYGLLRLARLTDLSGLVALMPVVHAAPRNDRINQRFLSFVGLLGFVVTAYAADPPLNLDPGRQFQIQQQQERMIKPEMPVLSYDGESSAKKPVSDVDLAITVKKFSFDGVITVFDEAMLQAEVSEYIGKTLTWAELQKPLEKIKRLYRGRGYFLARVFLPEQADLEDGIVTITILEGNLEDNGQGIRLNDADKSLRQDVSYLMRILDNLVPAGKPAHEKNIERAVMLLSDIPGVSASGNMEPGDEPGTTRLVVDVKEGKLFNSWVKLDNYGNRLTGEWQTSGNVKLLGVQGLPNEAEVYVSHSLGTGSSDYVSTKYAQNVGVNGLQLGASYRHLAYQVGDVFSPLNIRGGADSVSFSAKYPIIKIKNTQLDVSTESDYKLINGEQKGITTTDQTISKAMLGLVWNHDDKWLKGGKTMLGVNWHHGFLDLTDLTSAYVDDQKLTGPHTHGHYNKAELSLSRNQLVGARHFVVATVKGQWASKNLASAEKITLGGPSSVRAYPGGEASGDEGVLASLEAYYNMLPFSWGEVRLSAFYDWGEIRKYHDDSNLVSKNNIYSLEGYGLGVNVSRPGSMDFDLIWSHRMGNNPEPNADGSDNDGSRRLNRIWTSLRFYF